MVAQFDAKYGNGKWVAVFGGDNFNAEKPDIAYAMKYLSEKHSVPVFAIQSDVVIPWGGVDAYVNYVHYVPTVHVPALDVLGNPELDEAGKAKTKIHWGGFIDGKPAGPTGVYLGYQFVGGPKPVLKEVVAIGSGPIGAAEVKYASSLGVPVTYLRTEARFPDVNGPFGSLDQWALEGQTKATPAHPCPDTLAALWSPIRVIR